MDKKGIDLSINVIILIAMFVILIVIVTLLTIYFAGHGKTSVSNATSLLDQFV